MLTVHSGRPRGVETRPCPSPKGAGRDSELNAYRPLHPLPRRPGRPLRPRLPRRAERGRGGSALSPDPPCVAAGRPLHAGAPGRRPCDGRSGDEGGMGRDAASNPPDTCGHAPHTAGCTGGRANRARTTPSARDTRDARPRSECVPQPGLCLMQTAGGQSRSAPGTLRGAEGGGARRGPVAMAKRWQTAWQKWQFAIVCHDRNICALFF